MRARKGRLGWPLYEIALVIVIAGCVLAVLAQRIEAVLELAEKTAVETNIINLRTGLRLEQAKRIAQGKSVTDLAGRNPLDFLQVPLVGQDKQKQGGFEKLAQGAGWYYESKNAILMYRPARSRHLVIQNSGADKLLQWRIQVLAGSNDSVDVVAIKPYQWFDQ